MDFSAFGRTLLLIVLMFGAPVSAPGETAAAPNASVYIISPHDGDTVTNPFKVQFGLSGMGVAPAGVDKPMHGLRKLACSRLAEAGASVFEVQAVSGHRSLSEVSRYTKAASQVALARSAMAKATKPAA